MCLEQPPSFSHISVLPKEVLSAFEPYSEKSGVLIDCTLGLGGHSKILLQHYPNLKIIGIDQDPHALEYSKNLLKDFINSKRFVALEGRYSQRMQEILQCGVGSYFENDLPLVGILADIGVSSMQFDDVSRGFSFNSPLLDMRMNPQERLNAKEILNTYSIDKLEYIFKNFGEIKEYKKMVRLITQERKKSKFESARGFSEFIGRYFKNPKINPATLAFQALRIEVNDELGEISRLLETLGNTSMNDIIVAIISFHSLEDRIVKTAFKQWEKSCICPQNVLKCICGNNHKKGRIETKKPIVPTLKEQQHNPRSRSAKMRTFYFQ